MIDNNYLTNLSNEEKINLALKLTKISMSQIRINMDTVDQELAAYFATTFRKMTATTFNKFYQQICNGKLQGLNSDEIDKLH